MSEHHHDYQMGPSNPGEDDCPGIARLEFKNENDGLRAEIERLKCVNEGLRLHLVDSEALQAQIEAKDEAIDRARGELGRTPFEVDRHIITINRAKSILDSSAALSLPKPAEPDHIGESNDMVKPAEPCRCNANKTPCDSCEDADYPPAPEARPCWECGGTSGHTPLCQVKHGARQCSARGDMPCEASKVDPRKCRFCQTRLTPPTPSREEKP